MPVHLMLPRFGRGMPGAQVLCHFPSSSRASRDAEPTAVDTSARRQGTYRSGTKITYQNILPYHSFLTNTTNCGNLFRGKIPRVTGKFNGQHCAGCADDASKSSLIQIECTPLTALATTGLRTSWTVQTAAGAHRPCAAPWASDRRVTTPGRRRG